ncbi:MAG: thioredoxin family protein [Bacteroidales bacterium]|nr:thioredoxin family protein [Bacteroidales bacterium]MBN2697867.1 thioredoxin family protein [Bacteroidales bacterium]
MFTVFADAQLKPGDRAVEFNLKNIDGKMVSLSDYSDQKGVIVVFTCNPCPFAKAYENRIIQLHNNFLEKGYPVVAINPNDEEISPEDTFEKMKERAGEKNFPFPYLKDETQAVYKAYGATRTPHIYLLQNDRGTFRVVYIGAIDDNAMDSAAVIQRYVEDAIASLEAGAKPDPEFTKAIGCTIKTKD